MVQSQIAGRADVHSRSQAHGFHAAEHFDGVGSVAAIAAVDGANFSVFCFSFDDGCVDLSCGQSTPWRMPGLKPEPEFPDGLKCCSVQRPENHFKLLKVFPLRVN
jgi:hypothetical protein